MIEQQLRDKLDIPVFHDDQHGTAIIVAAGLINAFHLTGRDMKSVKIVGNGAGAGAQFPRAAIIVLSLLATSACCLAISALSCAINASPCDAPAIDPVSTKKPLITLRPKL